MSENKAQQPQSEGRGKAEQKISGTSLGTNITGFWRLYEIDRLISQGSYPNCAYLAELFEVHRRTVERDIERLRDFWRSY